MLHKPYVEGLSKRLSFELSHLVNKTEVLAENFLEIFKFVNESILQYIPIIYNKSFSTNTQSKILSKPKIGWVEKHQVKLSLKKS